MPAEAGGAMRIGVAGCGSMGAPMLRRLRDAGFDACGFDVRPAREFGDLRPLMVEDCSRFAAAVDTLISVVRDETQTNELCFDRQALLRQPGRIRTLVLCSTLPPRVVHDVRGRLPREVALVDAPMSGAPVGAREGSLTFMVGGPRPLVEELDPLFEAMGERVHHCGVLGSGMTVKVLNNYVAVASVVAVRRVLDAAPALGVDPDLLRRVMHSSSGGTWFGNGFERIDWSREGYDAANTIGILEKDLAAARDALASVEVDGRDALDAALGKALRALPPFVAD